MKLHFGEGRMKNERREFQMNSKTMIALITLEKIKQVYMYIYRASHIFYLESYSLIHVSFVPLNSGIKIEYKDL